MDEFIWRRIVGFDGNEIWLTAALLVALIAVAAWRPQSIGRPALFRMAYILLAVSILVPAVAEFVLGVLLTDPGEPRPQRGSRGLIFTMSSIINLVGKTLLAAAVGCALGSR